MHLLEAKNIHKTYHLGRVDVPVLRGVSMRVLPGEFVAILGASGSGKSTLLHLLGGLDRPTSGTISYLDKSLGDMSDAELDEYRSHSIGFVFQFYHLLPELSVIENVLLGAMIKHGRLGYAKNSKSLKERAAALLSDVGLSHRLTHRPAELSGGERQRVAIARSLMNEPPILLADEPTGNLDQKTGGEILEMLLDIRRKKKLTLVVVTHDLATARRADRSVHLVDGLLASEPADVRGSQSSTP